MQKQDMLNKTQIKSKYGFNDKWIALLGEPDKRRRYRNGESHLYTEDRVTALIESNREAYSNLLQKNEKHTGQRESKEAIRMAFLAREKLPLSSRHTEDSLVRAKEVIREIKRLFPKISSKIAREIGLFATEPKSGRVGTTDPDSYEEGTITDIAYLATRAYVRHKFTDYDNTRKAVGNGDNGVAYARAEVWKETEMRLKKWGYVETEFDQ